MRINLLRYTYDFYNHVAFLQAEIKQVLAIGASPDRIIFSNPNKEPSHLKFASENGVNLTVFDIEDELYKIHKSAPKMR